MSNPLMKCGHTANALTGNGEPVCAICAGVVAEAYEVDEKEDLTGRTAQCTSCNTKRDSSYDLAFFKYQPDKKMDSYYCGCRGWD